MGINGIAFSETLQESLQDIPGITFYDDPTVALGGNVEFDKTKFAGYANSVQLGKLLLLVEDPIDGETVGAGQLSALMSDLTGAPYEWSLLNMNGNHGGNIFTTTLQRPGQMIEVVSDDGAVENRRVGRAPVAQADRRRQLARRHHHHHDAAVPRDPVAVAGCGGRERRVERRRHRGTGLPRAGVVARQRHPEARRSAESGGQPGRPRSGLERDLSRVRRGRERHTDRRDPQCQSARLQPRLRRRGRHVRLPARPRHRARCHCCGCDQPAVCERRRRFRRRRLSGRGRHPRVRVQEERRRVYHRGCPGWLHRGRGSPRGGRRGRERQRVARQAARRPGDHGRPARGAGERRQRPRHRGPGADRERGGRHCPARAACPGPADPGSAGRLGRPRRRLRRDRHELGRPELPRRERQLPAVGKRAAETRLSRALHGLAGRHLAVAGSRRRDLARSQPVRAGHVSARRDHPRPRDTVRSRSRQRHRQPARSSRSATRTFSSSTATSSSTASPATGRAAPIRSASSPPARCASPAT